MSVAPPWLGGGRTSQAPKLTAAEVESGGEQQGATPSHLPRLSHQRLRMERGFSGARSQLHLA